MKTALSLAALALLTACATITGDSDQEVTVITKPAGAHCTLSNRQGSWEIAQTPSSVKVARSYSPLIITCKSGTRTGAASIESVTSARAYPNALLLGFPAFVDAGTGAGYEYDLSGPVTVELK